MTALHVHCCPTAAVAEELLAHYRPLLSAEEMQRLNNFRVPHAANEFLIGRALLRTVLAEHLQCEPARLQLARDAHGKPHLLGEQAQRWHFNLSHSRGWVVLAVSAGGAVGVDVECNQRERNIAGIAARFFLPSENAALLALPSAQQRTRFFDLWTLKESYVKAHGGGIAHALAGTCVEFIAADRVALHLSGDAHCAQPVQCWEYALAPDYDLAVTRIGAMEQDSAPHIYQTVPLQLAARIAPALKVRGDNRV